MEPRGRICGYPGGVACQRADGLGQPVRVRLPGREMVGRFEGLDLEGRLVLRTEDRAIALIAAGDVFPLDAGTKAVAV